MARLSQATADHVTTLHDGWQAQANRIRSNPSLSPHGKQVALVKAFLPYKQQVAAAAQRHEQTSKTTIDGLERGLFGSLRPVTGADAISLRDAQDRAARLETPQDAAELLNRATQGGDDLLARAVGRHAWDMMRGGLGGGAWGEVVQTWADSRPNSAPKLNQLGDMLSTDVGDKLLEAMYFSAQTPPELGRMSEAQLEELAKSDPMAVG